MEIILAFISTNILEWIKSQISTMMDRNTFLSFGRIKF